MKLYLAIFIILCANAGFSQSGDSVRTKAPPPKITAQDTIVIPFDTNYIKSAYRLSNNSETFGVSNWIWNDKRNLGEILNERPGFRLDFFNDGGRNKLFYYRNLDNYIGILKDGIQINDNFLGGFDVENISVNEIDTIEELSTIHSYLYGINTQNKAVNIITKDVFQSELYSQLRFTQDRYGSENADVYFSQSLSRKLNYQVGANKHSITGRYVNSDFDVWRARARVNWFISPKANLRFNLNYANIERGLNEGLFYSTEDTLRNPELAKVVNPDAFEKLTTFFYDFSFTGRLFKNRNSLTKLKIYSQNSLREYRDPTGWPRMKNFHTIQYGVDLKQNFALNINRDLVGDLLIGGNAYFNIFDFDAVFIDNVVKFNTEYYSSIIKLDLRYKRFYTSISGKLHNINNESALQGAIDLGYDIYKSNDFNITLFGGTTIKRFGIYFWNIYLTPSSNDIGNFYHNDEYKYTEVGLKANYRDILYFKGYQKANTRVNEYDFQNGTYELKFLTDYIDLHLSMDYDHQNSVSEFPEFNIKSDISFHGFFFNKNLHLRTGFNIDYMSGFYPTKYDPYTYSYYSFVASDSTYIDHLFNMDFYIGARIGSANIAFTFANILDNFNYDTFLYPWDDRGGAFNSLSRFSITWDFLD